MSGVKKPLLLLFLIPLFAFSKYVSALFFKTEFVWWDIVFFAAFILSVIALLCVSKKAVSYLVAVLAQAVPAVCALAGLLQGDMALKHYAAYAVLCLPALAVIAGAVASVPEVGETKMKKRNKRKSKQKKAFGGVSFVVLQLILIGTVIVTALYISKQLHSSDSQIDYIGVCFAVFILVLAVITAYLLKKGKAQQNTVVLMDVICLLALLEQIAYLLRFTNTDLTFVQVFFPLVTATVVVMMPFNEEQRRTIAE